jgi:hypothetical protein
VQLEEGISMASAVLMTISKDEVERARLESEYKYELDTQSRISYAKLEEKLETAKKALAKGSAPEFVADITGLSLDEITKL